MFQRRSNRVVVAAVLAILVLPVSVVPLASAYAEESISFRDPYTGQADQSVEMSTALDATRYQ